ncbi:MAG TPA: MaoC family dehydratase N-terminal domain-containing protein [Ilumatobacteraceae bacterium]
MAAAVVSDAPISVVVDVVDVVVVDVDVDVDVDVVADVATVAGGSVAGVVDAVEATVVVLFVGVVVAGLARSDEDEQPAAVSAAARRPSNPIAVRRSTTGSVGAPLSSMRPLFQSHTWARVLLAEHRRRATDDDQRGDHAAVTRWSASATDAGVCNHEPVTADLDEFEQQLAALVGKPVGTGVPSVAPDPVNQPMIRHWAAAFDDQNPLYTDVEFARGSQFGEIMAPPLMLQTWTMPTPILNGIRERGGSPSINTGPGPLSVLDDAGYVATLASNSEFEIERYIGLGEVLSSSTVIEAISEEKQTRVGPGRFVTWISTYTTATGEVVARQRFRILKFKPTAS